MELAQGDVEEVAAAAGGVQDFEGGQAALEVLQETAGFGFVPAVGQAAEAVDAALDFVPFGQQVVEDDGAHHGEDVGFGGVFGANQDFFFGIHHPLEKGAEDGGFNVGPAARGGFQQFFQFGGFHRHGVGFAEQVAVEAADADIAETPAVVHPPEQLLQAPVELHRVVAELVAQGGESAVGEEAHVLGEEAKYQAVEELGHGGGGGAAGAH